jgi:hypothetical protein
MPRSTSTRRILPNIKSAFALNGFHALRVSAPTMGMN